MLAGIPIAVHLRRAQTGHIESVRFGDMSIVYGNKLANMILEMGLHAAQGGCHGCDLCALRAALEDSNQHAERGDFNGAMQVSGVFPIYQETEDMMKGAGIEAGQILRETITQRG